jgi:hypothetical protein
MKTFLHPLAALSLIGFSWSAAQNVYEDLTPDLMLEAIREANRTGSSTTAPGTVAVPDPSAAGTAPEPVVIVTDESSAAPVPIEPESGLDVRVEKLRTSTGTVDPSQVQLLAPFPAKPLSQPPAGWMIDASDEVPPFQREVEISPGTRITLNIRPHLLVPDADGETAFAVPEPGFDPSLGYDQSHTVGAVLSTSVHDLDEHSKSLGHAIDSLRQLLVALPKPETPAPASPPSPPRKR